MAISFEAVRAEALFTSCLQPSWCPGPEEVRGAVAEALRRYGVRGCAETVAAGYGEDGDTAVRRMRWALAAVREVYGIRRPTQPVPARAA